MDELEAEGDSLFKPRGSIQEISVVLTHYKELQAQLKHVTLSSREWQDHQRALDEAQKKLEELNSLRGKLNKEKRQLERLKQALPYLSQRRSLLEKLMELGDVIVLPADFGDRRRTLAQEERDTCISLKVSEGRLLEL